ncbi:MAG: transcription antitermination factor NusB, partial [Myxococcota bacterium]
MTSKNKETRLNPRSEAARALMRVCKEQAYASRVLDAALSKPGWESRDRGLFTELVYGVLRRLYCLDHVLAQVTHKPLRTLDPWTLQHLRIAAYQLLYLERVPTHALIHEAVQQVKQHKSPTLGKFVNAVLRQLQRQQEQSDLRPSSANVADPVELASILYSHPQWLVQRYQQDLGMEQAEARLQQQCLSPPLTLRVHRTWGTREQLAQLLREREIVSEMTPYSADGLILSTSAGESIQELQRQHPRAFMVQDEAAQCIAEWLHPQNNERILDACAAPGGKTAHLAAHAPQAEIFAADIHPRKLRQIEALCTRLGIQNVNTFDADMTRDEPP